MTGPHRNRLVLGAAALAVIAAATAWQWSWLTATGIAPLLLSVAPCVAMCTLGVCMHRMGRGSCGAAGTELPRTAIDPGQTSEKSSQTVNQGV
jgi:hypothetical protein